MTPETPKTGTKELRSRILKTEDIRWKDMRFIQHDGFKEHSVVDKQKLKASLIENGFAAPFNVWMDPEGVLWCLDGYHRKHDLEEIETEGVEIPELLPANFIDCKNITDAAKLVLVYSSHYAKITNHGMIDFMSEYELSFPDIDGMVNIPDIDVLALLGDRGKDFSTVNQELDTDEFDGCVVLKLSFPREDYVKVKNRIAVLMNEKAMATPEELIKTLLDIHEPVSL